MTLSANRYLVLFLLFLVAIASYAIGFMGGFWVFILLGAAFELTFWAKLIIGNKRQL